MSRLLVLALILAACSAGGAGPPDGVLDCRDITEWQLASVPIEGHGSEKPRQALANVLSYQQAERGGTVVMLTDTTASLVVRGKELAIAEALPHAGGGWFGAVTAECDE